jgi:hypothetical protein
MSARDTFAKAESQAWFARASMNADRDEIKAELIRWRNQTDTPLSDVALTVIAGHVAAAPIDPQEAA